MAVKIRMQRNGRHKLASYRIVVADSRYPRDGRFIEILGYYDPTTSPATVKLDAEKAYEWIKKGAQPSDTVRTFLSQNGVLRRLHEEKNKKGE
ncbi:MAG: 30S ribosomal protein S16 [Erysipelotrichaceae bacterium]|nr:30S ribosomal protein S16 [Erysipelotrichaceae bacterium]